MFSNLTYLPQKRAILIESMFHWKIARHPHNHLQIEFVTSNESVSNFCAISILRHVMTPAVLDGRIFLFRCDKFHWAVSWFSWLHIFHLQLWCGSLEVEQNKVLQRGRAVVVYWGALSRLSKISLGNPSSHTGEQMTNLVTINETQRHGIRASYLSGCSFFFLSIKELNCDSRPVSFKFGATILRLL